MSDGERPLQQHRHHQPHYHNSGNDASSTVTVVAACNNGTSTSSSGGGSGPLHEKRGSITESILSISSGGNGYIANSSPVTSSSVSGQPNSTTMTNNKDFTPNNTTSSSSHPHHPSANSGNDACNTVIKVIEEPLDEDNLIISTGSQREDKSATLCSDSSVETFHTPSTSLQNLSSCSSHFGSSKQLNGSSNSNTRKISSEIIEESLLLNKFLEEEEILITTTTDSGTASLSVITTTSSPLQDSTSPPRVTSNSDKKTNINSSSGDKDAVSPGVVASLPEGQPSPNSSSNSESSNHPNQSNQQLQKKPNQKKKQKQKRKDSQQQQQYQQHKRQGSAGSQGSVSSNPENSQFKTADAHSSDSDASRNSGTTSGFVFDEGEGGIGTSNPPGMLSPNEYDNLGNFGSVEGVNNVGDPDRRSLQSDHSHSGDQLNTSVESVDFGPSSGEQLSFLLDRRSKENGENGHSPGRLSSTSIGGGSISPPYQPTSSHPQLHSIGSKPRIKKKMWYQQIFSTSYKTRVGDFKKIFKDLPPKERLIVDYSCALQKEILLQGRMYISQNYASFYANIFGWETQLSISFKEIESITKEKTALIIPNAIQISTLSEKFFFSSFVTRDATYVMLFKLWHSALLEDNMSKKELWKLVHTCYGEELGVTSEDESEDMYGVGPQLTIPTSSSTIITTSTIDGTVKTIAIGPGAEDEENGRSSLAGKGAPEITINKCDDDNDAEQHIIFDNEHEKAEHAYCDDDGYDQEPRIGSLEWCRLRSGSGSSIKSGLGLVCTGEIGPAIAVGLNIGSSIVTSNGIPISSDQLLVKDGTIVPVPVPILPMDPSDSSDAEAALDSELPIVVPMIPGVTTEMIDSAIPECPVDHTLGKEMMNTIIPCNIDQLFTLLFTNSTFYLDFQMKRKTSDINQSDWQIGGESQKTRQLTFTVVTGQTIGPSKAQVTETQTILPPSRPGLLYAIQSESVNAGIPYADCFSVNCHYCLTKLSETESNMVVISKIHYKKSTWAKTFIEKNSMSAMTDFFKTLEIALKEDCAKMIAGGITPTSPIVVSNLPRRRHPRKKCRAPDIPASALSRPTLDSGMVHQGKRSTLPLNVQEIMGESSIDTGESSTVMKVILTILGFLVLLNAFLYFKLSSLETAANLSVLYPPTIQFSGEAPQTHQEWLMLLQQQESLHRSEVHSWHEVLISAIKILHQAEKDLESLKAHISTYSKPDVAIVATPSPPPTAGSSVEGDGDKQQSSESISSSASSPSAFKLSDDNSQFPKTRHFENSEDSYNSKETSRKVDAVE